MKLLEELINFSIFEDDPFNYLTHTDSSVEFFLRSHTLLQVEEFSSYTLYGYNFKRKLNHTIEFINLILECIANFEFFKTHILTS